jgi:ABC-type multidrug transport system ATPase subunit
MAGTLELIRDWATSLPYWEQAALDLIAARHPLTEADYQRLLDLCMEDGGLMPKTARPKLSFPTKLPDASTGNAYKLERVFNSKNVNALPGGQELPFGNQLTVIYGGNGAGKTGYARPLGCAVFARGEREVLPDARNASSSVAPQIDIEVSSGGQKKVITWTPGAKLPEMGGVYVFDGVSLNAHLTRPNALNFAPAGLSLLTDLAEVTDQVRARLRNVIQARSAAHKFNALFVGDSQAARLVANLSSNSDVAALTRLATLSEADEARMKALDREIARLKSQDTARRVIALRQEVNDLQQLSANIATTGTLLSQESEAHCRALVSELQIARKDAEATGADQFKSGSLTQIGTNAWRNFIQAAHNLAIEEGRRGTAYPAEDDPCLLCRQELNAEAKALIDNLWEFLTSHAPARFRIAQEACASKLRELERSNVSYFGADTAARRVLAGEADLTDAISKHIDGLTLRLEAYKSLFQTEDSTATIAALDQCDYSGLTEAIARRKQEIADLESSDVARMLQSLTIELREFKHRQILSRILPDIKIWINNQLWAIAANQAAGSTRHITTKYNELFGVLVTDLYRKTFQKNLARLKRHLKVTIETRGHKGETLRQIVLSPEAFAQSFAVDKVLSDGEKRAVALADFITEVTLTPGSTAMILDDPVSSLDSDSRIAVAQMLAEEAAQQQVVVFTHELTFVHALKDAAKELSVGVSGHWIMIENGRPGYVYPESGPQCEADFKTSKLPREQLQKAKAANPVEREQYLQLGFGYLRSCYESLVIFEIFNSVVNRFEERVSFDRLKDIATDKTIIDEVIEKLGELSRHIDAHLHSDTYAANKPTPELLEEEIAKYEDLKKRIKASKKPAATLGAAASVAPAKPASPPAPAPKPTNTTTTEKAGEPSAPQPSPPVN